MSVQVSYKKQTALGIIGIVIILLVVEGVANVWWITQISCEFEQNEIFQNFEEVEKRQLCLDFYNLKTTGDEIIPNQSTDSITINSMGFRGTEFSEIKPLNAYRIFMVGGSTMFGAGATSDQTTIPGYMQDIFNSKDFGFDIQVVNSGIQGADTNTELKLIEQKLLAFSPDLLIMYDGWNDLRANNIPMEVKENWETICKLGKENNFDVIITLQPIAGFGNKVLTKQESEYAQNGIDYNNKPLIELLPVYQEYGENLSQINTCAGTFDLRDIFDIETQPIYWDQGHVSDKGNSIVATSLYNIISPVVSGSKSIDTLDDKKNITKTSSLVYDDREIAVEVELLSSNSIEGKQLKISTFDNKNNDVVQNVTYFLSISKDNENLVREYFFAEDGILLIDIHPNDSLSIKIIGEKQYDNNAYVMQGSKYSPDVSGDDLTSTTQIEIIGPLFNTEGIYTFDIELRTIDSRDNWVFSLSDFHSQIIIGNDVISDYSTVKNQSPLETKNFLRNIFSHYKTPILLNEIFKW